MTIPSTERFVQPPSGPSIQSNSRVVWKWDRVPQISLAILIIYIFKIVCVVPFLAPHRKILRFSVFLFQVLQANPRILVQHFPRGSNPPAHRWRIVAGCRNLKRRDGHKTAKACPGCCGSHHYRLMLAAEVPIFRQGHVLVGSPPFNIAEPQSWASESPSNEG